MASSAKEFRKENRKTVTLPSGHEVEIRKISIIDFADLGKFPFLSDPEGALGSSPELQHRLFTYSNRAIVRGAVSRVFTDRDEESDHEEEGGRRRMWPKERS